MYDLAKNFLQKTYQIEKILVRGYPMVRQRVHNKYSVWYAVITLEKHDSRLSFSLPPAIVFEVFLIRLISNYPNSQFWEIHQDPDCFNL